MHNNYIKELAVKSYQEDLQKDVDSEAALKVLLFS